MLHAFLDAKEVYILDEVAADQDPHYRKFFYNTVLPEIKKAGKTAIVVSHDDNYFHTADRIIEIKNGQARPYQSPRATNTM
jgi:ABC-type siderophore export system fused ATPase/permease subunit